MLLVTHFMDEAERLCDRVAIIDHGRLVALDTPKALVRAANAEARVRFSDPAHQDWPALEQLGRCSQRAAPERRGDYLRGRPAAACACAAALNDRGYQPADLRSEQVTLEDAFLALTGRAIREND